MAAALFNIGLVIMAMRTGGTSGSPNRYLGCYVDSDGVNRDMTGRNLMLSGLTVSVCTGQCQSSGFPYAGLQLGQKCLCDNSYGSLGASIAYGFDCKSEHSSQTTVCINTSPEFSTSPDIAGLQNACNTSCNYQYCGGYMSNDVYYAVDSTQSSHRQYQVYTEPETYLMARMRCVAANGDLPVVDSTAVQTTIIQNVSSSRSESGNTTSGPITAVWIGLRRRLARGSFEWTDENTIPYDMHTYGPPYPCSIHKDFTSFWSPTETQVNDCVMLDITKGVWKTASCDTSLPYVCLQIPPAPVVSDPVAPTQESAPDATSTDQSLALIIVLPIFLFCYGGSCMFYICYKIYRYCCLKKPMRAMADKQQAQQQPQQVLGAPPPGPTVVNPNTIRAGFPMYYARRPNDPTDGNPAVPLQPQPLPPPPQAFPPLKAPARYQSESNDYSDRKSFQKAALAPSSSGSTVPDRAPQMPTAAASGESKGAEDMSIGEILMMKMQQKARRSGHHSDTPQ